MERGPVAQASKPAVSPASKSAACRVARTSGGFGNPRYGRLGSLRYGQRVKYPGQGVGAGVIETAPLWLGPRKKPEAAP